jgi:hypothetical protein
MQGHVFRGRAGDQGRETSLRMHADAGGWQLSFNACLSSMRGMSKVLKGCLAEESHRFTRIQGIYRC